MELQSSRECADVTPTVSNYPALIRLAMRQKRVNKTTMLKAGVIKRSTWRSFDTKIDEGTISVFEFNKVLMFLDIEPVQAALTLTCLKSVDEYFESTCEAASLLAKETVISLTEKMAAVEGNFYPMKQTVCRTLAERQVTGMIERNRAINELRNRDFQPDR